MYIIQPALEKQYPKHKFTLNHVIGIDESELHTARIGVRVDNDLVWVGRAANYAAKLTMLTGAPIWITKVVYDKLNKDLKYTNNVNMWEQRSWTAMDKLTVYRSSYWWRID
jgi:class 3 adenylate cyclase